MRRKQGSLIKLEEDVLLAARELEAAGESEFHGYRLAREMQELHHAQRLIAHGTLYKALDRLEQASLLTSRWETPEQAQGERRPLRRLYRLSGEGALAVARISREHPAVGPLVQKPSLS